jgi:hypothetical protein
MSVGEFLARLTRVLDGAHIPTMFCGSIASTYYGMPRTTQDVDLVVDLRLDDIPRRQHRRRATKGGRRATKGVRSVGWMRPSC